MSQEKEWKHLPAAFRRRMVEKENEAEDEANEWEDDEAQEVVDVNDAVEDEQEDGDAVDEQDELAKLRNDISSANGRLRKLEEENAILRAKADNGDFAARRLLEIQQEREQAEKQAEAQNEDVQDEFNLDDLSDEIGELPAKALIAARQSAAESSRQVAQLQQQLQEERAKEHKLRFTQAVARDIPEIQTLAGDERFLDFLRNKTSFDGSSAFDFVLAVPRNLDISKIPQVRALIDEFKQGDAQNKKQRKQSVPPSRRGDGGDSDKEPALKNWTAKDKAYLAKLMRQPNSKEKIAEFKAKFKKE